ncbi:hypothetical protein [Flavobacterium sp. HJJ]|uniref:hypothetical protein n=1 Tax=Flavobacterium sp. HJJ TaxID=2783792 RepID=UPI001E5F2893|nr:hypothetical protein [Flavobacterium sp. HJJ]
MMADKNADLAAGLIADNVISSVLKTIDDLIASTVKDWNTDEVSEKMELEIGKIFNTFGLMVRLWAVWQGF